jgi:hypothetical protein
MSKSDFLKLQNSEYRCLGRKFNNKNTFNNLKIFVEKIIKKNFSLSSKKDLRSLSTKDLEDLSVKIGTNYQKKINKILSKEIDYFCLKIYGEKFSNFRVSVQTKDVWEKKNLFKKDKAFYDKKGLFHESKHKPNICFPTRPHQDLNNNGFRSSSILIFYIPLTQSYADSSVLQIAKAGKKICLHEFGNENGYHNEIKNNISKKLTWKKPKSLNPGNILFMDSFTVHKSSSISKIPRIALNIKIQPTNLNYIFINYKYKKNKNLKYLISTLNKVSKKCNSYNFELAVALYLNKEYEKSKSTLKKILNYNCKIHTLKKIMAGAFLRKDLKFISYDDYKNVFQKKLKAEKFSCADSILNTIN